MMLRGVKKMKDGAVVINAGRGVAKVIVDADLLQTLDPGKLNAAILDAFLYEPLPASLEY